jgi:hypothetical protein
MHNLSTMARPPARSGVLLLVLAACGPEDGASSDTADMSSTGTTTPTTTSETTDIPTNLLECGAASPCGVVLANSSDPGLPTPTGYTADQTCALQQLATVGPLRLHYSDGCEDTCYGALVLLRGDGSAIVEPYEAVFAGGVDLDGIEVELASFADSTLCILKPPTYFEACLAVFDNDCTSRSSWFDGCEAPAPASCSP